MQFIGTNEIHHWVEVTLNIILLKRALPYEDLFDRMLDASEVEVRRKGCFCIGSNSSRNLTSYKLSVYVMEEAFARSLTIFDSVATSVPLRTTTASTRQSAAGMPTLKTRTVFPETWIWNDLLPVKWVRWKYQNKVRSFESFSEFSR